MIQYKLSDKAQQLKETKGIDCTPVRGTTYSAGMDLKACIEEPVVIYPYDTVKIMTGVHVYLGEEAEGDVQLCGLYLPRSSNKGLQLENTVGLLDADFQGESFVKLYNKTEEPIIIRPGERLVQLVAIYCVVADWEEVDEFKGSTIRGTEGDGSTGKF